jgi:hypothetical protein
MRAFVAIAIVAVALSSAVTSAAGRALAPQPTCGATITVDTRLERDLVNCPSNGLVIGADNITLDLNGHVIDGDGTEFSDCPPDEPCDLGVVDFDHRGVTIKGGTIREFVFGVLVVGATGSRSPVSNFRTTSSPVCSSPIPHGARSTGSPFRQTVSPPTKPGSTSSARAS